MEQWTKAKELSAGPSETVEFKGQWAQNSGPSDKRQWAQNSGQSFTALGKREKRFGQPAGIRLLESQNPLREAF